MKFRTTLIALLLLVLSGFLVYLFEFRWAGEKQEREAEARKIFSLDWGELQAVKIVGSHGPLVLERKAPEEDPAPAYAPRGSGWMIVEPVRTDADDTSIMGLMTALKNLEQEQVLHESPPDLEPFGLADPQIRLELVVSEGEASPAALLVGGKSPVGENSYARREGESAVLLLNAYVNPQVDRSLYDLREKRIFRMDKRDIERVEIFQEGAPALEMARHDGRWTLMAPIRAHVVPEEAERILDRISGLTAQSFEDEQPEDLAPYGLLSPRREVRLTFAPDQTQANLLLGAGRREGGRDSVYAKRGEVRQVFTLDADLLEVIDADPENLRDRKAFSFQSWKVGEVMISRADGDIALSKVGTGKWRITRPVDARASSGKVSSFLSAMSRLEGIAFFDRPEDLDGWKRFGLDVPAVQVALYEERTVPWGQDPPESEEASNLMGSVILGRPGVDRGPAYAWLEGSVTVAEVDEAFFLEHFPAEPEAFRDKQVLDFHRYQVGAVHFHGPQGEVHLEEENGAWSMKRPVTRPVETGKVEALIDFLVDLKVDRFLDMGGGDPQRHVEVPPGFEPPEASVTLKDAQGQDLGTVLFSSNGPPEASQLLYVRIPHEGETGLIEAERLEHLLAGVREIEAAD